MPEKSSSVSSLPSDGSSVSAGFSGGEDISICFGRVVEELGSKSGERQARISGLRDTRNELSAEDVARILRLRELFRGGVQGAVAPEVRGLALEVAGSVPKHRGDCLLVQEALMTVGELSCAADFARRAVKNFPDCHHLWHNLGACLRDLGETAEALTAFREAVGWAPYSDVSLTMTGVVLRDLGRLEEALEFQGAAVQANPGSALALYNLGNALLASGETDGAVVAYRRALEIRPNWPELLNNLAMSLVRLDRHAEAIPHLFALCKTRNGLDSDLARLASSLREANRPSEALELTEVLIGRDPKNPKYRMLRGACLVRIGRASEAVTEYQRATELDPSDLECCHSLIYAANYLPYENPAELFSFYQKFGERVASVVAPRDWSRAPLRPFPRKLRIGYVSGDFCQHPVTTFIEPVLRAHDRSAFEVFCYYNHSRVDAFTRLLRSLPVHWRDIERLADADFCSLVEADEIDVLVDLSGHTARNRLTAFARKPARVQLTMVGCMQTTGLKTIDYRITDNWLDPVGTTECYHSEQLVRMHSGAVCYRPHPAAPEVAPPPFLKGVPFTFGSFNNLAKVTPPVLDLWAAVLATAPATRMQVVADSEEFFLKEMEKRGIGRERFLILRRLKEVQYLEAHAEVDLLLDTFPFNGLTITSNALWMGVPCVTLSGNTSASRAGASLQGRLGLSEFVTASPRDYLKVAIHYAANPQGLVSVRSGLREKMARVWADPLAYTRELEDVVRRIWTEATGQVVVASCTSRRDVAEGAEGPESVPQTKQASSGEAPEKEVPAILEKPDVQDLHADCGTPPVSGGFDLLEAINAVVHETDTQGVQREALEERLFSCVDVAQRLAGVRKFWKGNPSKWRQMALCGWLHVKAGLAEAADECFEAAIQGPKSSADWAWLSDEFVRSGRRVDAVAALKQACAFADVGAVPQTALGVWLIEEGDLAGAERCFRRAIGLAPSFRKAYAGLADCLFRKGDFSGALQVAEPVLRSSEEREHLMNLAAYHERCGTHAQAIGYLQKVLEKSPQDAAAYLNLGNCFLGLGMVDAAIVSYEKSLALAPETSWLHSNLLHTLTYSADFDQAAVYAKHREFARKFETPFLPHQPHSNPRDPERRLRIAYVSPDFRSHSVSYFVEPMLEHHDHSNFEVFGVQSYTWADGVTDRIRALCDHWIYAGSMSDDELAEALRSAGVDIVVDLICHSNQSRPLMLARKPAPIQLTMIGMQQTTGLDSVDFRVTDDVMDPPGLTEKFHSEKLLRLPVALVFKPPFCAPGIQPLPAARNGFITFGSFNNFAKVNEGVRQAWIRVLNAVPDSRFICVLPVGTGFEAEVAQAGIGADRLTFTPRLPVERYLELHHQVDFVLDTFPFAGLTVSAMAAWMGVPTLTIAGETPSARAGASLQHALGLDEFIARDADDFVQKAVKLASDLEHLSKIRESMRERMALQFTNGPAYMRSFEAAMRQAWREWCARSPQTSEEV